MRSVLILSFVSMIAASAPGQWTSPDKLLLPINPGRVQGGYGSEWLTDVAITNMSDSPIAVTRDTPGICAGFCLPLLLPARSTVIAQNIPQSPDVRGRFLFVEKGRTSDLAVTLRTRDLSRKAETWGTTIPVVSIDDLFSRAFGLVDVPMDAQFRSMLRIYDFNAETPGAVRVRVYALDPGDPLLSGSDPSRKQKAESRKQKGREAISAFCLTSRGSGSG